MNILGLMSGTSFDGVDAALICIEDGRVTSRVKAHFEAYRQEERAALRADLGNWQASEMSLDAIQGAHNRAIAAIDEPVDLIGFHGQTFAHDPAAGRTYQAGDPALLNADCPIVYDFRSDDIAAGGEGAPLIPIYHYALARELGLKKPVAFYNIGGVSNVTYVDPSLPPEAGLLAFDCGAGNALMDDLVHKRAGLAYDDGGQLAAKGKLDQAWLNRALSHDFFLRKAPKSLDRDAFQSLLKPLEDMALEDALASAAAFSIEAIKLAEKSFPKAVDLRIICGGGRKNKALMDGISGRPIEDFGLNGDMIEAEGFAYLAHRVLMCQPISFPMTTGVSSPIIGGKVYIAQRP